MNPKPEKVVALAPTTANPLTVTQEQIEIVRKTVANGATDAELQLYLYDCQRQGVHPLDRLLHFTKRAGKYVPVTSIDLMRIRAADTGEYAGSDDAVLVEDEDRSPYSATVTVWRLVQGTRCAFTATARWSEYCPNSGQDHMWRKMPATMIAKCAEALALRKGFPRQLAGMYAKEELDQAGNGGYESQPAVVNELPTRPAPDGYDEWLVNLEATADNGYAAYAKAWADAKQVYREYLAKTNRALGAELTKKAKAVDAERSR